MIPLDHHGEEWSGGQVVVESHMETDSLALMLRAPSTPIAAVHVRWVAEVNPDIRALSDAWERSYGDLGWRNLIAERVMPWYFATHDGATCHGYGVKTDARALCFWQLDPEGVSLWLNVTNGGNGVELGGRPLKMATVVTQRGGDGEDAMTAVEGLCRAMCARMSRPTTPIYGTNDWCYSYGHSTAQTILRDTEFIAGLSPSRGVRPFSVIDGGWSNGTAAWPDMGNSPPISSSELRGPASGSGRSDRPMTPGAICSYPIFVLARRRNAPPNTLTTQPYRRSRKRLKPRCAMSWSGATRW